LEVGTGFHPELTGRENIFLNGAILGMSKVEIKRKFDEIVAFAEIEKFLDTPVKRYSSGMYVRLAFAVAAHLEPEILVVDEVLAVGDSQFQKKCLGKMEDVGREGRTVLFVSHNMSTVKQLCTKGYLLNNGRFLYEGTPSETIAQYMQQGTKAESNQPQTYRHTKGDGRAQIQKLVVNNVLDIEPIISIFEPIKLSITYTINESSDSLNEIEFFVLIYSSDGEIQASFFQRDSHTYTIPTSNTGIVHLTFHNCLTPGRYFISAGIFDKSRQFLDWVEQVESFYVEPAFNDGRKYDDRLGKITLMGNWHDS
jgi:lipopolysaccharide transport system ATP-binding protein